MVRRLVLATANSKKAREFRALLGFPASRCLALKDFPGLELPPEEGSTFLENAREKALTVATLTGEMALADDSGLEVDALGKRPGVFSARFAGPGADDRARNEKLLRLLDGVPCEDRGASFVCALALARPQEDGRVSVGLIEARCRGQIVSAPRGSEGFGYDPLFLHPPSGLTFAQMGSDKHRVSHRGLAFSMLRYIWPRN